MAYSFYFYTDSGLTNQLVGDIVITQAFDGSTPVQERQLVYYFGSSETGRSGQARSNPGVDQIQVTPVSLINPWAQGTVYNVGNSVHSTSKNNRRYEVISVQGDQQSGGTEPVWPTTVGDTIVDNNVTWRCEDHINHIESYKLASTQVELGTATPGAPLDLGVKVDSGTANAKQVHIQFDDATGREGTRTWVKLSVTEIVETAN